MEAESGRLLKEGLPDLLLKKNKSRKEVKK